MTNRSHGLLHGWLGRLCCSAAIPAWIIASVTVPLPILTTKARAATTCSMSGASGTGEANSAANGTITTSSSTILNITVNVNCTSDEPGFSLGSFGTCSSYTAANPYGLAPWTAIRLDGTTESGSANNRIAVYPLAGNAPSLPAAPSASADGALYGNRIGTGSNFSLPVRYAGIAGATIESGEYQVTIPVTTTLIDYANFIAPDESCSQAGDPNTVDIPLGTALATFTITVPETCTAAYPGELDFGNISNTTRNNDASANVTVNCNSNRLTYNVFITGSSGTDNSDRQMSDGNGNFLTYGLYRSNAYDDPFPNSGLAEGLIDTDGYYQRAIGGATATIWGRIPPQTRPASGDYSDTVQIHVQY